MRPLITIVGSLLTAVALIGGCGARHIEVRQYGRMHDVLSAGAKSALPRVDLTDVLERPGAVGVGALAGLEGEITILDGKAWIARPTAGELRVEGPSLTSRERAALLTVAYVEDWREVCIERNLAGDELEHFIGENAYQSGIDPADPFPFSIEGELADLQMHVINGECPMRPGVRLTSEQEPWRHSLDQPTSARIVGIYAPDSVGNLTHPGTSVHAHVLLELDDREVTGHVERIAVAKGAVLKLPIPR